MDRNAHSSPPTNLNFLAIILALLGMLVDKASGGGRRGTWELLRHNAGVAAMHMALTHSDTVVIFDQTGAGRSGYRLPHLLQRCSSSFTSMDESSCWAHSVEYRISTNTIRPLTLKTDTWCSSASFLSNGTLLQTGGNLNGSRAIRYFHPCDHGNCDWFESNAFRLADKRWYSSNLLLPDNRVIVVGGRRAYTYEFVPKSSVAEGSYHLPFLRQTENRREGSSNLYPFLHLSTDGNLFIFANRDSILFDFKKGVVLKTFPQMPGNRSRSYPSTGSSVMLPLDYENDFKEVEIMVCGGAASGAYMAAKRRRFRKGLSSCGRMIITDKNPTWAMEEMPAPRLLNDMLILPTGNVLIINGAKRGCAGWDSAATPSRKPYLYKPKKSVGKRFSVLNGTEIPRMYHSSALVLPDGRVLVAGSNPHRRYIFRGVEFPTELRLEAFVPYYMGRFFDDRRPGNLSILHGDGGGGVVRYGEEFSVLYELRRKSSEVVGFHVYAPPFVTHSLSMNQRMVKVRCKRMVRGEGGEVVALLVAPPSPIVAPPGYYLLTVVNGGIPSKACWLRFADA